jgi:predicted amidohydrolase
MTPPTQLVIAAAQSISIAGDIAANLSRHLVLVEQAAAHGVQLLVFPELSLTGYELALGRALAMRPDDARLQPLRDMARRFNMTVIVGAPLLSDDGAQVGIGALVCEPGGGIDTYRKQHLHGGEQQAFAAGDCGKVVTVGATRVVLAICADILQAQHAQQAADMAAQVYAAGVLISEAGYAAEAALLRGYAQQHGMAVLLANHGGVSGGWQPAGRSAVWSDSGELIVAAPGAGELLVVARRDGHGAPWSGQIVTV